MFKIGDIAVYPAHGVGIIESIEERKIYGNNKRFYILRIIDHEMTIMIPTDNIKNVGLRQIIDAKDVPKIYETLMKRDLRMNAVTWNRRHREYTEKIRSGSLFEIAEVFRDLLVLKLYKSLSFGEKKMLEMAQNLLIKEISIAMNKHEREIEKEIWSLFNASRKKIHVNERR